MIWQLILMWSVVLATIAWFVRDERRLYAEALDAQARAFAVRSYNHPRRAVAVAMPAPPRQRMGSLLRNDRAYFLRYLEGKGR